MTSIKISIVALVLLLLGSFYINKAIDDVQMHYLEAENTLTASTVGYKLATSLLDTQLTADQTAAVVDNIHSFVGDFTLWDIQNGTHLDSQTRTFVANSPRQTELQMVTYAERYEFSVIAPIDGLIHVYTPIFDANDNVRAVLETTYTHSIEGLLGLLPRVTLYSILGMALLCMLPLGVALWYLLRLQRAERNIRKKALCHCHGAGLSQVSKLEQVLQDMCKYIARYTQSITQMRQAYEPFLPRQIIGALDKHDITELAVGQRKSLHTWVLLLRATNFLEVVDDWDADATFAYTNDIFNLVIDEIGASHLVRFVDVDSDIIIEGKLPHVLSIASALMRRIHAYHQSCDKPMIHFSFAVVETRVDLGIVGCKERSELLVRMDANDLCKELYALSSTYQTGVLFAQTSQKHRKNTRCIAISTSGLYIYEDYSAKSAEQIRLLNLTKTVFEQSVLQFFNHDLAQANAGFIDVIHKNNGDAMAYHYFEICNQDT